MVCTLNQLFEVILTHTREMEEDDEDYIHTLQSKSQDGDCMHTLHSKSQDGDYIHTLHSKSQLDSLRRLQSFEHCTNKVKKGKFPSFTFIYFVCVFVFARVSLKVCVCVRAVVRARACACVRWRAFASLLLRNRQHKNMDDRK